MPGEAAVGAGNGAVHLTLFEELTEAHRSEVQGWRVAGPCKDFGYQFWANRVSDCAGPSGDLASLSLKFGMPGSWLLEKWFQFRAVQLVENRFL